jgi:cytochrome P450
MVSLMIDRIHRHPSAWSEPDRFDPDRFSPERSAGRHPAAFIPFGVGKRQCIGKGFAMLEGVMLLAMILQRFQLEPMPDTHLEPQLGITRRLRGGMPLTLRPRA